VIKLGDPLFNSIVREITFVGGLNDASDIVFRYMLANGVTGIAVARVVPEPASIALLGLCALVRQRRWQ